MNMRKRIYILALAVVSVLPSMADTMLNLERMEQTRSEARAEEARAALIRQADKMLAQKPTTILDQQQVAPSGDKHDYYSMARYWWPNPKKADGLPYIRKDGVVNPATKGLGREVLSNFKKQVEVFALAYFYTGKEVYAAKCADCLRAWYINPDTRMNPTMEYSQVVLGQNENKGRHEGLLDTYTMLFIPNVVACIAPSRAWTAADTDSLKAWFERYVDWMTTAPQAIEEDNFRNNHGTAYHVQLMVYAAFVGRDSLAEAYRKSFTERRLVPQIRENGTQPEELNRTRGFGYSIYNLTHILDYVDACYAGGYRVLEEDTVARTRICAALDFLAPFLGKPVESWPYQQINDWEKQQENLWWVLYRAQTYFPERDYAGLLGTYKDRIKTTNRRWLY